MTHCFALLLFFTVFVLAGFAQTFDCAATDPGVRICSPDPDATLGSVATVIAGATAQSGNITAIRAYIDDTPVFTTFSQSLTNSLQAAQDVNVDEGVHHLVIVGYQDDGGAVIGDLFFSAVTATFLPVSPIFGNCIPSQPGAIFCHPDPQQGGLHYPVQILAGATAENGYITALRLYVDDVPQLTIFNPQQSQSFAMNEPLAVPHDQSPHTVVLVGYDSTGGAVTATQIQQERGIIPSAPSVCHAPNAPGVNVCSPPGCTVDGVYFIRATGTGASGSVDHMELWVNDTQLGDSPGNSVNTNSRKLADFPGNSINTNMSVPLLFFNFQDLTVVEVDSNGDYIASNPVLIFGC
jgi:hypothetical protein